MLFDAREKRIRPGRDEKILAGWNGLMIRGLAFASRVFQRPEWAKLASRAADFVLREMWKDGRLFRSHQEGKTRIDGFIEDYGDLAAGLTALYQATFEAKYLEAAAQIADAAVERFWHEERQAYFSAPKGQKDLLCATYALHDNAFPSGASTLTEAQVALAALTGQGRYLEQAGKYLRKLRDEMMGNPFGYGHLLLAADAWLDGAAEVTLAGKGSELTALLEVLNQTYSPTVAVAVREDGRAPAPLLAETFSGKEPVGGRAAAYFCRNFSCLAPVTEPPALKALLDR
jgi:uncharacterized protein YyaL (SSP411 family)